MTGTLVAPAACAFVRTRGAGIALCAPVACGAIPEATKTVAAAAARGILLAGTVTIAHSAICFWTRHIARDACPIGQTGGAE